jgi:hypothetical protein
MRADYKVTQEHHSLMKGTLAELYENIATRLDDADFLKQLVAVEFYVALSYLEEVDKKGKPNLDLANAIIKAEQAYSDIIALIDQDKAADSELIPFLQLLVRVYETQAQRDFEKSMEFSDTKSNAAIATRYKKILENYLSKYSQQPDPICPSLNQRISSVQYATKPSSLDELHQRAFIKAELASKYRGLGLARETREILAIRLIPIIKLHERIAEEYDKQGDSVNVAIHRGRAEYLRAIYGMRKLRPKN